MTHLCTESKKIFALILMTALMSVFVGCATNTKEYEKKPIALSERVGDYEGTIPAGSGGGNVKVILSTTAGGTGKIEVEVTGSAMDSNDSLVQTASQMAATGTTFNFNFSNIKVVTVVFDSETEATGAKATFTVAPNTITIVLTKK